MLKLDLGYPFPKPEGVRYVSLGWNARVGIWPVFWSLKIIILSTVTSVLWCVICVVSIWNLCWSLPPLWYQACGHSEGLSEEDLALIAPQWLGAYWYDLYAVVLDRESMIPFLWYRRKQWFLHFDICKRLLLIVLYIQNLPVCLSVSRSLAPWMPIRLLC